MAGQKFTLTFDAQLNVNQMKGALNEIQKGLSGLNLPQNITNGLQNTFNQLAKEVQNFEALTSKSLNGNFDTRKIENSATKIERLFRSLQIQVKDLGNLSGKSLQKLFPDSAIKQISAGEKALSEYGRTVDQISSKVDAATKKVQEWQDKLSGRITQRDNQAQLVEDLKNNAKSVGELAQSNGVKQSIADYEALEKALDDAKQKLAEYQQAVANGERKANKITESGLTSQVNKLQATKDAYDQQAQAIKVAETQLKSYENAVNAATQKVAEYQATLQRVQQASGTEQLQAITKLFQDLSNAGFDTSKYTQDLQGAQQAVRDYEQTVSQGLVSAVNQASSAINNQSDVIQRNTEDTRQNALAQSQLNDRMRDVSALKSRIQYFFGLNNTINLFRNAVRE